MTIEKWSPFFIGTMSQKQVLFFEMLALPKYVYTLSEQVKKQIIDGYLLCRHITAAVITNLAEEGAVLSVISGGFGLAGK